MAIILSKGEEIEKPVALPSPSRALVPVCKNDYAIIGNSSALRSVLDRIETVASTDSTVLLCGETGTGKEVFAHAIHEQSLRRDKKLVKLNCAAIPSGLLESELFGHEKGAFTGALTRRIGRFELADEGTLLLDEIGDIPLELQPKLLRVLQEGEFERLGSCTTIKVDVRLIAATHRDLPRMLQEGAFRADLYYRINVFPIAIPPLRERMDDVPSLAGYFLAMYSRRMNREVKVIPLEVLKTLINYAWPGNIRELQNLIERAVIMSSDGILRLSADELKNPMITQSCPPQTPGNTLKTVERDCIVRALDESGWIIGGRNGAAARLGLPRTTLIYKMRRLGVTRERS